MSGNRPWRGLVALVVVLLLTACEDQTEPKTKHRSLADAAAQLRSSAMVDTTWRGHVTWNASAGILKTSDCYLLENDYVLVGRGDNVSLRLVYTAERAGEIGSVAFGHPQLVELQLDGDGGARFRSEPPAPADTEISAEPGLAFGTTRLQRAGPAARRNAPEHVEVSFEFYCP